MSFKLPRPVVDCCIALLDFQKPSPENPVTTFKPIVVLKSAARYTGLRKKDPLGRLSDIPVTFSQTHASVLAAINTVVLAFSFRRNKNNICFCLTEEISPHIGTVHMLISRYFQLLRHHQCRLCFVSDYIEQQESVSELLVLFLAVQLLCTCWDRGRCAQFLFCKNQNVGL